MWDARPGNRNECDRRPRTNPRPRTGPDRRPRRGGAFRKREEMSGSQPGSTKPPSVGFGENLKPRKSSRGAAKKLSQDPLFRSSSAEKLRRNALCKITVILRLPQPRRTGGWWSGGGRPKDPPPTGGKGGGIVTREERPTPDPAREPLHKSECGIVQQVIARHKAQKHGVNRHYSILGGRFRGRNSLPTRYSCQQRHFSRSGTMNLRTM
jgi:hypothetical protein